ncbi:uncharacterized protein TNCV_423131 [Trichonephila clavipes]|nr:uncharacterized protein TNCV_423131 [Trichonephila clavipes]
MHSTRRRDCYQNVFEFNSGEIGANRHSCGSAVVKVSDNGMYVMSSSPVPQKTRHVGQQCTLNLSRAEKSLSWCGMAVGRRRCQLRCRPRHLTLVQVVLPVAKSPIVAEQCDVNIHSLAKALEGRLVR